MGLVAREGVDVCYDLHVVVVSALLVAVELQVELSGR